MKIYENFSLKDYNTFGVDVTARYFAEVSSTDELIGVLKSAREKGNFDIKPLFLGGGSNILFTKDYEGLVIQLNLKGISKETVSENEVLVTAAAGENWHSFVLFCLEQGYGGLENLSLIPGNVGTSPMQNIGAYGVEIKDVFENCKVLNLETLETEYFDNAECKFGYRDSIFKNDGKGKYVILDVTFRLTMKNHVIRIEYGAIKSELERQNITDPTIRDVSDAVISIRQSKLPDPKLLGNAGSFFKNPTISKSAFEALQQRFPAIPGYASGQWVKVPAGWLIEQCGWKGKEIGNVASHHLQALVIVNKTGQAGGAEIFEFSQKVIDSVEDKFGITLEREVNII